MATETRLLIQSENMKVRLGDQAVAIRAPRSQVFKLLSYFGQDNQATRNHPSKDEEGAKVLEREGNRLLVEFTSKDGRKHYKTLEEVRLYPEERITFRHLQGPMRHASEEFRLEEVPEGTSINYSGQIECRMPFLPVIGWVVALLYVRPKWGRVVKRHMGQLKEAAESHALENYNLDN